MIQRLPAACRPLRSGAGLLTLITLLGCGEGPLQPEDATDSAEFVPTAAQPTPGVYSTSTLVSGFPLGVCGYGGAQAQRDSDLNAHNAPYTMEWTSDSCLTLRAAKEGCGQARDRAECETWRSQLMKIVFPMSWTGPGACLTPAQQAALQSASNMKSINIGTVSVRVAGDAASPRLSVGTFRIFRHNGNYQYEMVANGSRQPFLSAAFRATFPTRTSLDGMQLCFDQTNPAGLGLPAGKTPLSCVRFHDQARAERLFGALNQSSTAYGFYDPGAHHYCPVSFAPRPR